VRPWLAVTPLLPDVPLAGQDWNQAEVLREVDGDTARLRRRRVVVRGEDRDDLGPLVLTDVRVRLLEDDALAGRLVNLDTPESHEPGYAAATADLAQYVTAAGDRLRCVTYDQGGGFDRLLVDLYFIDAAGRRVTASECMMVRGWLPYVRGK
jgi:hypothetical protein